MAKIHFLNEAVTLEVPAGQSIYEIAQRAGINLFAGFWKSYHCGGKGRCLGTGCRVWVNQEEPGSVSPKRSWTERIRRSLRGTQRLACQAQVSGDCEIRTQPMALECQPDTTWEPDTRPSRWRERLVQYKPKQDEARQSTAVTRTSVAPLEADVIPDERAGTVIASRYRILEALGVGGMGVVFLAEHIHIRRRVAIKLLHRALMTFPEVSERFEREAIAIGRIDHPNCVGISDFGRLEDDSLYLVMELVDGECLADIIDDNGRVSWRRALRIARHVLRGIAHAHEAGIVHRDIKPDNIVLTQSGSDPDFAKIVDFGIAKLTGRAETETGLRPITLQGVAFGTPAYMSPEQASGDPVDGRADLYSLSIVIYEMITGCVPFTADTGHKVLAMQRECDVPTLSSVGLPFSVPPAVEHLLSRGLAKDRNDRFQSASEYGIAVDDCLRGYDRAASSEWPVPV